MVSDTCTSNTNIPNRIFSAYIVLMMLANVYLLPFAKSIAFGEFILILLIPILLFYRSGKLKINIPSLFIIFSIYACVISFMMAFIIFSDVTQVTLRLVRDAFYWFIIFVLGYNYFEIKIFKKWIDIFCIALTGMLIIQTVVYYSIGYYIPGFFLNATLSDGTKLGLTIYNHNIKTAAIAGYLKPNGFLCEPANCAQVLLVGLALNLYGNNKLNSSTKFRTVFFSVGMILTMSASGYAFCIIIWLLFAGARYKDKIKWGRVVITGALVISIIVFVAPRLNNNAARVLDRLSRLTNQSSIDSSSSLRIHKGFSDWEKLPFFMQLFGAGYGNWEGANILYSFSSSISDGNEYMNTVAYILFSAGIVGFLIMTYYLVQKYKQSTITAKCFIITLVIVSLCSSIYSTVVFTWIVLIIESNKELYSNSDYLAIRGKDEHYR